VSRYVGHSRGRDRLSAELVSASRSSSATMGLADTRDVDGYLDAGDVAALIRRHGLKRDDGGRVTLRATSASLAMIEGLAEAGPALAALDLAESLDARERAAGLKLLDAALGRLRA
jgi:hypothetical protein